MLKSDRDPIKRLQAIKAITFYYLLRKKDRAGKMEAMEFESAFERFKVKRKMRPEWWKEFE